jgi:tetratricopeptide (TPR) repeat protein
MFAGIGLAAEWTDERARNVDGFVSSNHRHFHSGKAAFFDHPGIGAEAKTVYERMLDAGALQDHAFFDAARRRWRDRWNRESPGGGPSRHGLARAETFLLRSLAAAEDGHLAQAVEAARRAAAMAPGNAQYHAHLGGLLTKTGDLTGAEAAIREAIGLDAERAGFHHTLGHVLLKAGRIDEAVAAQRRATLLDGSDPRYRTALDTLLKRRPS